MSNAFKIGFVVNTILVAIAIPQYHRNAKQAEKQKIAAEKRAEKLWRD